MQKSTEQRFNRSHNRDAGPPIDRAEEYFSAAEIMRNQRTAFSNSRQLAAAAAMRHPVSIERAFAVFGLALGLLPLTAIILRVSLRSSRIVAEDLGFLALFILATIVTAAVGYVSGSRAARAEAWAAKRRLSVYATWLPVIGIIWGAACGFAGGIFIFLIGAFFGGVLGAAVAGLTFPLFSLAVRTVAIDGHIDAKHLLPILIGTVGIPTALILGM